MWRSNPCLGLRPDSPELVQESSRKAVAERGRFSIAVPGGSATVDLLPSLIPLPIDWSRTDVFWVDERMVPPDDTDSNFRAARIAWLDAVPIPGERVHRMRGEDPPGPRRRVMRGCSWKT